MMQTCTLSLIVLKDSGYDFRQQGDNCFAAGTGIFQFRGREGMEFATIPFSARNQPALLVEAQTSNKVLCTCKGYITFEENIPLFNIEEAEIQTETAPVPEAGSDEKPLDGVEIQPEGQHQSAVAPVAKQPAETESKPTASKRRKEKSNSQTPPEKQPKSEAILQPEPTEFENSFDAAAALDESEYIPIPF
ncbi:MAG: hypothetical protein MUE44_13885 [Oscillatoriaceae cyanobacterium Prado104]|nr:hypothetical protein [Oscillatoriaceae cyanobacterium Prado104]